MCTLNFVQLLLSPCRFYNVERTLNNVRAGTYSEKTGPVFAAAAYLRLTKKPVPPPKEKKPSAAKTKKKPSAAKTDKKKDIPFKNAKWCDFEDDNDKEYGDEEVAKIIKEAGLPHMDMKGFKPETPKPKLKEVEEPRDAVYEHGSAMGRANNGRGAIPRRP